MQPFFFYTIVDLFEHALGVFLQYCIYYLEFVSVSYTHLDVYKRQVIDTPSIAKSHAVLTRYDDGSWTISDIGSRGGVSVNGRQTEIVAIDENDVITLGNLELRLVPNSKREQARQAAGRTKAGHRICLLYTSDQPGRRSAGPGAAGVQARAGGDHRQGCAGNRLPLQ